MHHNSVISYPHMGSYSAIFEQLFRHLFPQATIISPPCVTKKTMELGSKYSPDFVCSPFKYNLGNFIEALDQGANILFQTGTGCRYGYYGELQEQILRDMGYDFTFICLSRERSRPLTALKCLRKAGCKLAAHKIIAAFHLAVRSIHLLDQFEYWSRENIGFQAVSGSVEALHAKLLNALRSANSLPELHKISKSLKSAQESIHFVRPKNPIRVGMVGELFTLMEPFSNFHLEKKLAKENIIVSRQMSIWFLLFGKKEHTALRKSKGYLRYTIGANGVDSIAQSLEYSQKHYDGILHIKSFGCIPELNATPTLLNIAKRKKIPILSLSFDSQTSETGIATRLEAFTDMLKMRKESKNCNNLPI